MTDGSSQLDPASTGNSGDAARRTINLLGAQFLRNLAPLVILLLLARITTPELVGTYSLALAIVTPIFVFAQLGMRTVTLTLNPEGTFRSYVTVQSVSVLAALVVVVIVGAVSTPHLLLILVLTALLKTADAFADFLSGPLQRRHRSGRILTGSLISAVVVSAGTAITLILTRELVPTLAAIAFLALGATYIFLFRPASQASRSQQLSTLEPQSAPIRRIVSAGVPLGLAMSAMSLISSVPQYLVTSDQGPGETARLAILLYVYALADIVTGVVSQSWIPHAQDRMAGSSSRWAPIRVAARGASLWTLVYIPVTAIGMVAASALIPLIFGRAYALSLAEAIPLGAAVVALPFAHFMSTAVAVRNYYSRVLTIALGSTALSLIAFVILIPAFGVAGAFWGLFVSVLARGVIAAASLCVRPLRRRRS